MLTPKFFLIAMYLLFIAAGGLTYLGTFGTLPLWIAGFGVFTLIVTVYAKSRQK
jgi:hypothetical protein